MGRMFGAAGSSLIIGEMRTIIIDLEMLNPQGNMALQMYAAYHPEFEAKVREH